jgi:hypothetical protein
MPLADLSTLINASVQNLSQLKGLTAAYSSLLGGTPSIAGYTTLIETNNSTNFGSKTDTSAGPSFNDENVYINTINALYQGNADAKAAFDAIVGSGATLSDKLELVYNHVIPAASRSDAGLAAFKAQADFYTAKAVELGVAGNNGAALVAFAGLAKIAVDGDIGGLGDGINDLKAAIDDGSAAIPEDGDVFTPLETADGVNYDVDDVAPTPGNVGDTFTLTDSVGENVVGTAGDDTFVAVASNTAATDTLNIGDIIDGGPGSDTANLFIDGAATALPAGSAISNVETINLISTAGGNAMLSVNSANYSGATQIWQVNDVSGAAVSVGAGVTAGFRDVTTTAADAVTAKDGVASLSVALDSVNNASNITFDEATPGDVTSVSVSGDVDTAAGVNTLAIDAGTNLTAIETVTISLSSDTTVTYTQENTETLLDFSGSTGDLTLALSNAGFTEEQVVYKAGTGNSTYNVTVAANAADVALDLQLNSGDDIVVLTGASNLTAPANQADLVSDLVTITNFSAADDTLDISGLTALAVRTVQNVVNAAIDGETTLFDAATAALGVAGGAVNDYVMFDFGGDTYIGVDVDGGQDLTAGDTLIQVTGVAVLDLDATNFIA